MFSYMVGHAISALSGGLIENQIVRKRLGDPSSHLFGGKKGKFPFAYYKSSYPYAFIDQFKRGFEKIFKQKFSTEEAFMLCYTFIKEKSSVTYSRLERFITLYSLSRNLSLTFLLVTPLLILRAYFFKDWIYLLLAISSLGFSALFFLRYLKFFWIYSDEVFRTFHLFTLESQNREQPSQERCRKGENI